MWFRKEATMRGTLVRCAVSAACFVLAAAVALAEEAPDLQKEYRARLARIDKADPAARLELGRWCLEQKLRDEAIAEFRAVVSEDPKCEAAIEELRKLDALSATKPPAETPAPPEQTPQPPKPAPTPELAEGPQKRLMDLATQGRLSAELIDAFQQYANTVAKEKFVPAVVPEEFWKWLSENKPMRDSLLVGLHPGYNPNVVKCLHALHEKFGEKVDSHYQLALAFAFVWGSAEKGSIRQGLLNSRMSKGRDIPTMEQSFEYYLTNESAMRMPLRKVPWPLLVYVADNDAPISERTWALNKYQKRTANTFPELYHEVALDIEMLGNKPRIGDKPRSLQNLMNYGGIWIERGYFSTRVLKSMGVPALFVTGEGARGGHAWAAWINMTPRRNVYEMVASGRSELDKYYTGSVFCPTIRREIIDREVQLLAAAVGRSHANYMESIIGCHVYYMFEGDARKDVTALLKAAVNNNPLCDVPWLELAKACADGIFPQSEADELYEQKMLKEFEEYPDLTYYVLETLMAPRLKAGGEAKESVVASNLRLLQATLNLYSRCGRPDLAVKLLALNGKYLEAVGRQPAALKMYMTCAEKYAPQHYSFAELFDSAVRLLEGEANKAARLQFLRTMAEKVPKYQSDFHRQYDLINPSYVHVITAYASELRANGRKDEAEKWENRLKRGGFN
jgi:hypothetical protein